MLYFPPFIAILFTGSAINEVVWACIIWNIIPNTWNSLDLCCSYFKTEIKPPKLYFKPKSFNDSDTNLYYCTVQCMIPTWGMFVLKLKAIFVNIMLWYPCGYCTVLYLFVLYYLMIFNNTTHYPLQPTVQNTASTQLLFIKFMSSKRGLRVQLTYCMILYCALS